MGENTKGSEKDITQWQMVEIILGVKPENRDTFHIEQILPWFRDRSAFFRTLEKDSLLGMIRYATLSWHRQDSIVIRQGEIGDCFYVIVRGSVSVYARPTKRKASLEVVAKDLTFAKGIQDRLRFGNELAQLTSGRCFGELSVLKKDGERNASIITDEPTLLICFKRATFLKFVHEKFANELLRKSGFVQACPLFKKWPSAYKNLLTECLQIRNVEYGESIVVQGSDVTSLFFVIKGQAKLCVNTDMHLRQYRGCLSKNFYERLSSYYDDDIDEDDDIYKFPVLLRRRRKEKEGFFATEMRQRPGIDLCVVVSENGLIGDIEAVYDLPTYSTTYNCLEAVTLYELDISSFIRLIVKKNPETFETMQKIVASKIRFRHSSIRGGIPLYAALMDSDKKLKSEGQPKFLPKLLVLQKKSKVQRQEYGKGRMQQERNKVASRWQKVKMNINPATGEVTIQNMQTAENRKNSAAQWEENRRKQSLLQKDTKTTTLLPNIRKALPDVDEDGEGQQQEKGENDGQANGKNKKLVSVKLATIAATKFQKGARKGQTTSEKQVSLDEYKDLRKRMQSMSKGAHRVSWTG